MYVRVHKSSNKWFRDDNGALVGIELEKNTRYYKNLIKQIGNQIIVKNNKHELKTIYYGHFVNNKFIRLDLSDSEKIIDSTCGYYAFILD